MTDRYSRFSQLLHWSMALAIAVSWFLAEQAEEALDSGRDAAALAYFANHKSVGMTIFILAVIRLIWRQWAERPALPATMPGWQKRVSTAAHYLLYGLLIGLPLSGWLGSSASAYSVSWFNVFSFPDLIGANESLSERFFDLHHTLWLVLQVLLLLHVAAALKHGLVDRDGVMSSMWSTRIVALSVVLLALAIAGVAFWQQRDAVAANAGLGEEEPAVLDTSRMSAIADSWRAEGEQGNTNWQIDYANSRLSFTADQAGATFDGAFEAWEAVIRFDPSRLEQAGFDVLIDLSSVQTGDGERDSTLLGAEFFAIANDPSARFFAADVVVASNDNSGQTYVAHGYLLLKGLVRPLQFEFDVEQLSDGKQLEGTALINRHVWRIGEGEWADDSWIGPQVRVQVRLSAAR